jgi:hypothetical protein
LVFFYPAPGVDWIDIHSWTVSGYQWPTGSQGGGWSLSSWAQGAWYAKIVVDQPPSGCVIRMLGSEGLCLTASGLQPRVNASIAAMPWPYKVWEHPCPEGTTCACPVSESFDMDLGAIADIRYHWPPGLPVFTCDANIEIRCATTLTATGGECTPE